MQHLLKSRFFALCLGLGFIVLDQWVKILALLHLDANSFKWGSSNAGIDLGLSLNPGAFLSLGAGLSPDVKQLVFIVGVGVVVIWAAGWALARWKRALGKAAAVYLIALGGGSDLIDRALRGGHVVDYLVLNLGHLHTGVFNIADMAIMGGAAVLVLEGFRKPKRF